MDSAQEILARIPHRQPFIMVDRVVGITPGRKASALKKVTPDSLSSGWGGGKYYPEAFILEAMAQVGALAAAPPPEEGSGPVSGFLAAVGGARFLRRPQTGDEIFFELEFEAKMGGLVRFKGTAWIDGLLAAEAVLTFSI